MTHLEVIGDIESKLELEIVVEDQRHEGQHK